MGSQDGRTSVIGVLPEFTAYTDTERLLGRALELIDEGADAVSLDATDDWAATQDGLTSLRRLTTRLHRAGVPVGIATAIADVAVVTIDEGASWILDPSGGLSDPFMASIAAISGVDIIVAQWHGSTAPNQRTPEAFFSNASHLAWRLRLEGVPHERIILDAGVATLGHDGEYGLLDHLDRMRSLDQPLFVDAAYGQIVPSLSEHLVEYLPTTEELDAEALGLAVLAVTTGAWGVRVHNVPRTVQALHSFAPISGARRTDAWLGQWPEEWAHE
jgi:dihydropteroate synthase